MQISGRVYKIGHQLIQVPQKAVEKIIEWNQGAKRNDVQFDRKICYSLLLSLVAKEKLLESCISQEVIDFIKGKH